MYNSSCLMIVVVQVNESIMLSIVTDPQTDYIFVTDYELLGDRQEAVRNQACRTVQPSTPFTSVAAPNLGESKL